MVGTPSFLVRISQLAIRFFQWISALIVMGISSYFIDKFPAGKHVKYEEVIAVLSLVFFLPGLISPFMPRFGIAAFPIELAFSYLWLISFVFTSQDYKGDACFYADPPGAKCSIKRASQAFTFLTFFCCLCSVMLEIRSLLSYHGERQGQDTGNESTKEAPSQSGDTAGTGTTTGQTA